MISTSTFEVDIKSVYDRDGFVKVSGLISQKDFEGLVAACDRAIKCTRSGLWPYRRTVGKQFPPYDNEHPDSWGVQHIMHPDLGEQAFVKWYTSETLLSTITQLLECTVDDLQMELCNLLINPQSHSFALRWHRDDIREYASEEEEKRALSLWQQGVQWNTALYTDKCLYVIPGSHRIPRTPEQRKHSSTLEPPINPMKMPGAIQVVLQPGDTVFYNSNIMHCAVYNPDQRRATLHACMGDARGGSVRARNILQHSLSWMKEDGFRDSLDGRSLKMWQKLMAMESNVSKDLGYSLA